MPKTPEDVLVKLFGHLILKVDDLAVVIIKGHLLVEELMLDLLAARVFKDREALEKADLKFAQILSLCRAWAAHPAANPVWDLIAKLNVLRNDLGHSLEAPKRQPLLADIKNGYLKLTKDSPNVRMSNMKDDHDLLIATFALVGGVLMALANPGQAPPLLSDLTNQIFK